MGWYLLATSIFLVDQITKYFASSFLIDESIRLLPVFTLHYICNTGALFGMFADFKWVLSVIGVVLVVYFTWEIGREIKRKVRDTFLVTAYSLILGGAAGNVVDRIWDGCVTDFLFFHYASYGFPIFNVADMAITFGAICWIWTLIRPKRSDSVEIV